MKKLTSIFLVIAMFLTLAPMNIFAAEPSVFSDMKTTDYYATAATALVQLDILSGYPDGTFGAEKTITRAEMAAVVCRMIDKQADADAAKGATSFDDVPGDHWASGYINVASSLGIISGDGNGKFRPEDNVRYEEAIKMVVCALGYGANVVVDANDWSKGYLDAAEQRGITKNLIGTKGTASTRGDVAVMSYNALASDVINSKIPATPVLSKKTGEYLGDQKITIRTATTGASIHYTTNGSTPTERSTRYTGEITVSKTTTIKAIAVKNGVVSGKVASATYTIKPVSFGSTKPGSGGNNPPTPPSPPVGPTQHTVSFDLNYSGATGTPAAQNVNEGDCAVRPADPDRTGYAFVGWYTDNVYTLSFDFSTPVTQAYTLVARWIDLTDTTDTDVDGLTDPLEEYYGTDKTLPDTDGDGLSDYIEIKVLNLDPLKADTDNNGTADGNEDADSDTLTNLEEVALGTDPVLADTDNDGLNDKEEITLGTNPTVADTDGDGVSDGREIELGTDPLVAQQAFNMSLTADNNGEGATASVQMELSGEQVETLSIQPVNNDLFFPETMPGYMGQAYDFNVEGTFSSATISFEFDPAGLGPDADPVIYYFNEETQDLEALETTVNGNVASATVTHFSKYILVDRKVYEKSFVWIDYWEEGDDNTYSSAEIVLVIDDSGSLGGDYGKDSTTGFFYGGNDPQHKRLEAARNFVDGLNTTAKVGIIKFDYSGEKLTETLVECSETGKNSLKELLKIGVDFNSLGMTAMFGGMQLGYSYYSDPETYPDVLRTMVVFTDGKNNEYPYSWSNIKDEAIAKGIKIYTVGLGGYDATVLNAIAADTGTTKAHTTQDADKLLEIYNNIGTAIDLSIDSDSDNIPDYYEDNMIMFNGVTLSLDKNNPDSDGDGIPDGDEVVITKEYNADRTKVKVTGKLVLGDPTKVDTDGDGIDDKEDATPLDYTITDRTLALVEGLSYTNLMNYAGKTVGYAIDDGVELKGISKENAKLLKNAIILYANNSGSAFWSDFFDNGLGSVCLMFVRPNKPSAVVYAIRGTEFSNDLIHDGNTDVRLGFGWDSIQSKMAYAEYRAIAMNRNFDYYITGHSLGGRLVQDVLYKVYNANEGILGYNKANIPEPVHSATFNALGYNKLVYATLENDVLARYADKLTNFYYPYDLVGEGLACTLAWKRSGTDVMLIGRDSNGNTLREGTPLLRDSEYHGIQYFQKDYDLFVSTPKYFDYWID